MNTQVDFSELPIYSNLDINTGEILIIFEVRELQINLFKMDSNSKLNIQMCVINLKSKIKMYRLSTNGEVYLPFIKQVNYNYISEYSQKRKSIINIDLYFKII